MQLVDECFFKVKTASFKYISSQENNKEKFKNKDRMIRSFLIPICFWISKKAKKKLNRGLAKHAAQKNLRM